MRQAFVDDKENRGGDHSEEGEDWFNRSMGDTGKLATTAWWC